MSADATAIRADGPAFARMQLPFADPTASALTGLRLR
jgi:hypothetical protein